MVIKKKTILLIDDDPDFCNLVKTILEAKGMEIVEVPSLTAARQYLLKEVPDIILLDMQLQGEHGTDFLQERGYNPTWMKIPVVVCSSQNLASTVKAAIRFGADDYLLKPIKQTWLIQRIRKCLIKEQSNTYFFEADEDVDVIVNSKPVSIAENSFMGRANIGFGKGAIVLVSIPQPDGAEPLVAHFKADEKSRYSSRGPFDTLFSSAALTEDTKNRVKMLKTFWRF